MNIQEKAEKYAREKLGNWCHVVHSAYETDQRTNGEVSVQDYSAGYNFAMSQPKHIFDGVAQVGEVRRFGDDLVDVVKFGIITGDCEDCVLFAIGSDCRFLTSCETHSVIYIKR